ncbi:MAG: indole-3-glycerol phosphate synthase TrpC [Dysgonamonadaceae bacterium]|jgi:indole-3-glycerol phosphate synthase|nr:indole-3-glycerol phosphate synthase TrpC [Dysgonamonadaceae bacterium]
MDILETIVANKRREVAQQKKAVTLDFLLASGTQRLESRTCSMRRSLEASPSGIIAEFKRRSPSKGWLYPAVRVEDVLPAYGQGGAAACSVLTDSEFFGGSLEDLQHARSIVALPLLRKDFIIDEYQLYQTRVMGADAVLLIAASLTERECRDFAVIAHRLDLEVLLEVHREEELRHLNEHVDMLGVNNRNLGTFDTDINNSFRMIERMKAEAGTDGGAPLFVSESGISDADVVRKLRDAGFRGFLMGETFMKTENPGETMSSFIRRIERDEK